MAGRWKPWKNPETNQWDHTFAIINGEPNELMQPIS
jgi:putative SOS response-associated peptidase YedK